LFLCVDFPVSL